MAPSGEYSYEIASRKTKRWICMPTSDICLWHVISLSSLYTCMEKPECMEIHEKESKLFVSTQAWIGLKANAFRLLAYWRNIILEACMKIVASLRRL